MSTASFRFKQFEVYHDRCAMKVGTDGVLLGAWAEPALAFTDKKIRILDVGTGSGLIALMLCQRYHKSRIDAIDIDSEAVAQAAENFSRSPWAERLNASCRSLQSLCTERERVHEENGYDMIVSNPPYFRNSLKNPDKSKEQARHTDSLSYEELICCSEALLTDNGILALILPAEAEEDIMEIARNKDLYPIRLTHVFPKPGKEKKRILAAFSREKRSYIPNDLYIESSESPRSEAYQELTKDFYL
ncbi:MAG: methyltransferase [Paludibacteraceae bacterium]|nr:methyltransferase [Paludibacteraceae bacterium]